MAKFHGKLITLSYQKTTKTSIDEMVWPGTFCFEEATLGAEAAIHMGRDNLPGHRWMNVGLMVVGMLAAGFLSAPPTSAATPYEIDVVTSLTGGAAMLGQTGKKALQLAESVINQDGGIQGRPVSFRFYDDETNPQNAVQLSSQILATGAPVLLGASLAAQCNAMAPLMRNGPVMYCLSPAPRPASGGYMFTSFVSSDAIAQALLRYFRARGWTKLGMITTTDATGQDADRAFDAALSLSEFRSLHVVDREHFNPGDISVNAQLEKLRATKPDALIAFTTGAGIGTVFRSLAQTGFDVPVATSTGNEVFSLMKQYASTLPKDLYFASGAGSANGDGLILSSGTLAAKKKFYEAFKTIGQVPDFGAEVVWDPAMIVVDALRHLGFDTRASAVRDYIAHLNGYAGVTGVYDFEKYPQRGLGAENAVVVRWNQEKTMFEAVSQLGGKPIAR